MLSKGQNTPCSYHAHRGVPEMMLREIETVVVGGVCSDGGSDCEGGGGGGHSSAEDGEDGGGDDHGGTLLVMVVVMLMKEVKVMETVAMKEVMVEVMVVVNKGVL